LLGDGQGTFGAHQEFLAGKKPIAIAFVAGSSGGAIVVANDDENATYGTLASNRDGTFQAYAAGKANRGAAAAMVVGDVNHDDVPDLVLGVKSARQTATGVVVLGNSDGTFGANGPCR
jgi:hypothetical protein